MDNIWKEVYMRDLGFKITHGKRLTKENRISGNIPLLTAGENNQGVAEYIQNPFFIKENVISVDMFGTAFYHNYKCSGDDNIYFFENDDLSENIKLFITVAINSANKNKYSYGKQFRQPDAEKLKIMLPYNNNEPDYYYMEEYIAKIKQELINNYYKRIIFNNNFS